MREVELPPLPKALGRMPLKARGSEFGQLGGPSHEDAFGADQVREYARQAVLQERERCARIAETPVAGEQDDITMGAKDRVASAIRKGVTDGSRKAGY